MKELIEEIPLVGGIARLCHSALRRVTGRTFPGTVSYWEKRYAAGGGSGMGSCGRAAHYKAKVLNDFTESRDIASVIEFGSGDGNQLQLAHYRSYLGFDVSPTAVEHCRELFRGDPSRTFALLDEYHGERADAALSIDVIFHLVEDEIFKRHMTTLFHAGERFVIIYSSNTENNFGYDGTHVRRRRFTGWVEANAGDFILAAKVPGPSQLPRPLRSEHCRDFYLYERR